MKVLQKIIVPVFLLIVFAQIDILQGQEICIDSSQIRDDDFNICLSGEINHDLSVSVEPVCGCDSITYINYYCARISAGVMQYTKGGCDCIDSSFINIALADSVENYYHFLLGGKSEIVCGCDSVTYRNKYDALYRHGVTRFTKGPCDNKCVAEELIDTAVAERKKRENEVWGKAYLFVCGCDGITYGSFYDALYLHGITDWEIGACPDKCMEPLMIDSTEYQKCYDLNFGLLGHEWDSSIGDYEDYEPVCGCDGFTYYNKCEAIYNYGITSFKKGRCPDCRDTTLIDTTHQCPDVYEPVCGCDSITYNNECEARYYHGIPNVKKGECPCYDSTLIDTFAVSHLRPIHLNYDPVCGCDSITYFNKYYAQYLYGIRYYKPGPCKCIDSTLIDTNIYCVDIFAPVRGCDGVIYRNPCIAYNHYGVVDYNFLHGCQYDELIDSTRECDEWDYDPVCGCDSVTYFNLCQARYKHGILYYEKGVCAKDSCIDENLINELHTCLDVYKPVCGCDSVTYTNACIAKYRYGVRNWTEGACTSATSDVLNSDKFIALYPNPALDIINIDIKFDYIKLHDISIYNILGEKIYSFSLPLASQVHYSYDISTIPAGLYTIILVDNGGKRYIKKFVKE